jgi:hypothetical protein
MNNKFLTPQQERIIDTIHNLVWHRITHYDKYLENIPEIDSKDFHDWIYYMKYEFIEYDDSIIQAVIYLNGKHYEYMHAPQYLNGSVWVNEIQDSEVESKIIELRGEIYKGFEIYNPNQVLDKDVEEKLNKLLEENGYYYEDLPF